MRRYTRRGYTIVVVAVLLSLAATAELTATRHLLNLNRHVLQRQKLIQTRVVERLASEHQIASSRTPRNDGKKRTPGHDGKERILAMTRKDESKGEKKNAFIASATTGSNCDKLMRSPDQRTDMNIR